MKKRFIALFAAVTMTSVMLMGCGGGSASTATASKAESTAAEESVAEDTAEESTAEAAASGSGSFSLLDVSSDMINTALYATDDTGAEEYVFSLFTGPDKQKYASLFMFENNENSGDVICGTYTAETTTDDKGIQWTMMTVSDVYTNQEFKIGCAEPSDGSCYIFDQKANVYTAKYLTADEAINYMGAAAALISK
ncbi:MAG TPA: hypothetical protein PLN48_06420 [Lachnospiraceae bacterium]|nr:hypothetical protein [Lachnospiraceae bacterium]